MGEETSSPLANAKVAFFDVRGVTSMSVQPQKGRKELAEVPSSTPGSGHESRSEISNVHRTTLSFDPQEYTEFLAETDWTDVQKKEFLEELWKIIITIVDLGFHFEIPQEFSETENQLVSSYSLMLESEINLQIARPRKADFLESAERMDS